MAFDPKDDNTIYAGTYHLPWKTSNGGKDWFPIVKGMIDDSDVMSIIVDPANVDNVHATACSGIYHSVNGGTQWVKYQGIPSVFRRTQLIRMDPSNPEILFAGTTSGLWKTVNDKDFKRVSPGDWIINALIIDPKNPQKLIIGTERQGRADQPGRRHDVYRRQRGLSAPAHFGRRDGPRASGTLAGGIDL